jgi:hypothetical protein
MVLVTISISPCEARGLTTTLAISNGCRLKGGAWEVPNVKVTPGMG